MNRHNSNQDRKSVRFPENYVDVTTFEVEKDVNIDELWYNANEVEAMRRKNRQEVLTFRRQGLNEFLNETFGKSHDNAVQNQLNFHVELCEHFDVRGLERMCSDVHNIQRKTTKEVFIQTFLAQQGMVRDLGTISASQKWEILARLCSDLCHEARVYARRIALADSRLVV